MNDETKKSLMKLDLLTLSNMHFNDWLRLRKDIRQEQEEERRKNDPKYVKRFAESHNGIIENDLGLYVLYEDFVRFVKILEEKADKAYQDGRNAGSDRSCSWRD